MLAGDGQRPDHKLKPDRKYRVVLKIQGAMPVRRVNLYTRRARVMVKGIHRELVVSFGKTNYQAEQMIKRAKAYQTLKASPLSLHDSPHEWAIKVLTADDDMETLEKYYSKNRYPAKSG